MNEKKSIIGKKSFAFALKIIDIYKKMYNQKEYVLSKQLLRSGTSIGANTKEARATKYWLRLIQESNKVDIEVKDILKENDEIIKILTSIVKTSKENLKK